MRINQVIIRFENELRKDEHLGKAIEKMEEDLMKRGHKKYFIIQLPDSILTI
jgi:hypothetical protein